MGTNAYYLNQFISTTLATVGGIDDSQTTGIILTSVTGVETTKPGIVCLSYSDPIDTSKAEWISYTSISVTNELQGVTRGAEGFSAKSHSNGVTIAFPISESHINNLNDALIIGGSATNLATGVIDDDTFATASATKLATSESIKAYADNSPSSIARQAIINGNFDVWQRGTSTTLSDNTLTFLADRWRDYTSPDGGTSPTLTRTREILTSGDISNAFYYTRLTTDGAGSSLGVNAEGSMVNPIEHGTRLLCGDGKKLTLSFWARSSIANKRICPALQQQYGTGGSPSSLEYIKGVPITLTSSWTKYTHTFTTNTLSGKTFGTNNDDILTCNLYYMWGETLGNSRLQSSVTAEDFGGSGTIDIAQVQLCAGDVALPFMPKSYEEELRACQRYYEICGYGMLGQFMDATFVECGGMFKTQKRVTPTASIIVSNPEWTITNVASYTPSNATIYYQNNSQYGFTLGINGFTGASTYKQAHSNTDCLAFSAEL